MSRPVTHVRVGVEWDGPLPAKETEYSTADYAAKGFAVYGPPRFPRFTSRGGLPTVFVRRSDATA